MDYEKAYKAVLQTATQWIKDGCTDKEKICLECVFPELAESEDERIRKRLINLIRELANTKLPILTGGYFVDGQDKDYIAYLEKQKEEEGYEAIPVESTLEYKLGFNAGKEARWRPTEEQVDALERTVRLSNFGCDKERRNALLSLLEQLKQGDGKQKEQKPAEWSDDDDQLIGFIFDMLNDLAWREDWAMSKEECLERLKSLRPVKQEWREEDEKILNEACCVIDKYANSIQTLHHRRSLELFNLCEKLKSLPMRCPKSSDNWKPSEEQMEAFRSYIKDFQEKAEAAVGGWNNFDVMIRLFEQLKELI